jgi:hypothetical protein
VGDEELFPINWLPSSEIGDAVTVHNPVMISITRCEDAFSGREAINQSFYDHSSDPHSSNLTPIILSAAKAGSMSLVSLNDIAAVVTEDEASDIQKRVSMTHLEEFLQPILVLPDPRSLGMRDFAPKRPDEENLDDYFLTTKGTKIRKNVYPECRPDPASIQILNTSIPSNILWRLYNNYGDSIDFGDVFPEHWLDPSRIQTGLSLEEYMKVMMGRAEAEEERERQEKERQEEEIRRKKEEEEARRKAEEELQRFREMEERLLQQRKVDASLSLAAQLAMELKHSAEKDRLQKEDGNGDNDEENSAKRVTHLRIRDFMGKSKRAGIYSRPQSAAITSASQIRINSSIGPSAPPWNRIEDINKTKPIVFKVNGGEK